MEINNEMEYCSTDIINKIKSNMQSNSGIVYTTADYDDEDENCDIVCKEGQQLLPANIRLLAKTLCAIDDEPWAIEEDDDYNKDNSDDPTSLPTKTVSDKKIEKSNSAISKTFPNDKEKDTIDDELWAVEEDDDCNKDNSDDPKPLSVKIVSDKRIENSNFATSKKFSNEKEKDAVDDELWGDKEDDDCNKDNSDDPKFLPTKLIGDKKIEKSNSAISKTFPNDKEKDTIDDHLWAVEEDDDYNNDNSDDPKFLPLKTVSDKKIEKSSSATLKSFPNDKDIGMYINSAFGKIFENIFYADNAINTEKLQLEEKFDLSKQLIFNKYKDDQDLNETNKIIWNDINIAGTSCSTSISVTSSLTDLTDPSDSTYLSDTSCLTDLPDPSCSSSLLDTLRLNDLLVPPCSRSLLDTSCLTDSTGPSYSLSSPLCLTDLPGPACSMPLPGPACSMSLPDPSCSTDLPGSSCSTSIPGTSILTDSMDPSSSTYLSNTSCLTDLPVSSCSRSLLDASWLTDLTGPSFSLPSPLCMTGLPGPSCSTSLPDLSCSTVLSGLYCSTSIPGTSSLIELKDPFSSKYLSNPSCSTYLPVPSCSTSLPDSLCSTNLPGPS